MSLVLALLAAASAVFAFYFLLEFARYREGHPFQVDPSTAAPAFVSFLLLAVCFALAAWVLA